MNVKFNFFPVKENSNLENKENVKSKRTNNELVKQSEQNKTENHCTLRKSENCTKKQSSEIFAISPPTPTIAEPPEFSIIEPSMHSAAMPVPRITNIVPFLPNKCFPVNNNIDDTLIELSIKDDILPPFTSTATDLPNNFLLFNQEGKNIYGESKKDPKDQVKNVFDIHRVTQNVHRNLMPRPILMERYENDFEFGYGSSNRLADCTTDQVKVDGIKIELDKLEVNLVEDIGRLRQKIEVIRQQFQKSAG